MDRQRGGGPARRRHLLRLWLSLDRARSPRERALTAVSYASLVGRLAQAKVRMRRTGPAVRRGPRPVR